ncbi:L-serine ammonia-lyase [Saccharopolyspora endophytica]|uniref:L-serine dehydratase n=1 Tax=Saccharopolyspora endophytica TaxID=543886 RepID=A0ABS5DFZ3_9PSEU|nr:L-serine ammonia-lyase [Saccharopolyspora endophytica]MBQ0925213.1 L-serine ammonia-lyase [Saccharopolyspora endophytica]
MTISVFDLFSVGIGPSSSHTVGPMRAAQRFTAKLRANGTISKVNRVKAELFGSLGATGRGHGSPNAVLLGLEGHRPESVDPVAGAQRVDEIDKSGLLRLGGDHVLSFTSARDLVLHRRKSLPEHPNGMRFTAIGNDGSELESAVYYSVGGGFVVDEEAAGADRIKADDTAVPMPFSTGADLLIRTAESDLPISGVMLANELSWREEPAVRAGLLDIWRVMRECVDNGCRNSGELPGGLKVRRRAAELAAKLTDRDDPLEWVTLFALAVNEENAAGGRVVTAPTNGAAGIVPAVLHYYARFVPGADEDGVVRFLLTAGAIGVLFKENASISGAEVGCQGEVGSACSMAAAGLAEVLGGTPSQVENAAEIAMEHNLGLTCDPIGGLVQIPCIERNAVASVKAITAARMALRGDGTHFVSLDKVMKTMRETGRDMKDKYKETARGGLAVNVIEC